MIVTKQWLQEFIDISEIPTETICKKLNEIGLEVDSLTKIDIPDGVVIGKVIECEKHPDADKLSVTKVDLGSETVQIVCGAKNVAKDQFVPVATVGTELSKDFKIKKAKLRGVESLGMICSSTELGLPKINDGILELDESIGTLILGKNINQYKSICDDIIEIELTANRGDCLSIYGIARELSAAFEIPLNEFEKELNYNEFGIGQVLEIETANDLNSSMIYKAIDFSSFSLPLLYKIRTSIIDKLENNDIKNALSYVIHSTGVILNAYPQSSAKNSNGLSSLVIKKDEKGFDSVFGIEKLTTVGVSSSTLNDDTTCVVEASYINPELISKKVFETKIKTGDSFYKSSRGSEPNIIFGIDYFTTFISKNGGEIFNGSDSFVDEIEPLVLDVSIKKINSIIGQNISKIEIEKILKSLSFLTKDSGNGVLNIQIPLFRHDIKNIADVTEEIVRIVGIDNIQAKPLSIEESNRVNTTSKNLDKKNKIRAAAISNGFFETLSYIFTSKENLIKFKFPIVKDELDILNPITNELNTFRTTMLINLIEAVSNNVKLGFKSIALFEIGTVFNQNREESRKMTFVFSGEKESAKFSNSGKPENINFYEFAQKVQNCIGKFELVTLENSSNDFIHPYQSAKIFINGKEAGIISKLHPNVATEYDLSDTFFAEIDFDLILNPHVKVTSYSKFQSSKRDLSLIVPKTLEYSKIKESINTLENSLIKDFILADIYSSDELEENQSLTIRFTLQSDEKTLEDEDITKVIDLILEKVKNDLNIGLR